MVHHTIFAVGTSVSSLEPFFDAWTMKSVKAGQYHILLFQLIVAHAYSAALILLGKVLSVSFCKP
jgi:hypothetical protein